MDQAFDLPAIETYGREAFNFLETHLLTYGRLAELGAILAAAGLAFILTPRLRRLLARVLRAKKERALLRDAITAFGRIAMPTLWLAFQWLTLVAVRELELSHGLLVIMINLLSAWIIIRLAARLIRQTVWSNLVFFLVWGVVALNLLGLLDPLVTSLDSLALSLGQLRISALTVIKGMAALAVFLWAASLASRFLSERIRHIEDLTPTLQVLLSKLLSFVLAAIAVVAALGIAGVNLTAFAVLGGALGIGIGLGLQNAASNIMGGLMLLLDKSIKPGDVIAVGDTFGWVTSMGGRYVSIRTRDGIEHLIPNEVFITKGIENWSFSDRVVRLKLPIGISYKSDVHRAIALCLEAAAETPRVVKEPASVCLLKGFGDSAVELELRVWIRDPEGGVSNVKSDVLLGVWDKFHAHGIEIPFPQRDLHIKPPAEFKLVHDRGTSHVAGASG